MPLKLIRRGEVSNERIIVLLDGVYRGKIKKSDAIKELGFTSGQFDRLYKQRTNDINSAKSSLSDIPITTKKSNRIHNDNEYDSDVQKVISYKGIIRPLTLSVANRHGGTYKLRVINIYVKPNYKKVVIDKKTGESREIVKDNTRYYEDKVYSVDKGAIAKGTSSDYYYPDKALWSKHKKNSRSVISPKESDIIELRKKSRSRIVRRIKLKKSIKHKMRRTIKKR
jgi:hypothetical protein